MTDDSPSGARVAGIGGIVHFYGRAGRAEMTDQERAAHIRALLEERRGYEKRGEQSRVDLVDKVLRDMGAEGAPPAKRAATRVVKPEATRVVEAEATEVVEAGEIRAFTPEGDK